MMRRVWSEGDRIELNLPMAIRFIRAHPRVNETAGKVAVQRGPLVFCAEERDNGPDLHLFSIDPLRGGRAEFMSDELSGRLRLHLSAQKEIVRGDEPLYGSREVDTEERDLILIPYHQWANRGKGEMRF